MGLYNDLITDITEAFNTDLADAVKVINIVSFGDPVYDPVAGTNTPVETAYTSKGVVSSISEEAINDDPTLKNGVSILILDSDKAVPAFEIGMKITIGTDTQAYKLNYKNQDPADVTHTLSCGRWS